MANKSPAFFSLFNFAHLLSSTDSRGARHHHSSARKKTYRGRVRVSRVRQITVDYPEPVIIYLLFVVVDLDFRRKVSCRSQFLPTQLSQNYRRWFCLSSKRHRDNTLCIFPIRLYVQLYSDLFLFDLCIFFYIRIM